MSDTPAAALVTAFETTKTPLIIIGGLNQTEPAAGTLHAAIKPHSKDPQDQGSREAMQAAIEQLIRDQFDPARHSGVKFEEIVTVTNNATGETSQAQVDMNTVPASIAAYRKLFDSGRMSQELKAIVENVTGPVQEAQDPVFATAPQAPQEIKPVTVQIEPSLFNAFKKDDGQVTPDEIISYIQRRGDVMGRRGSGENARPVQVFFSRDIINQQRAEAIEKAEITVAGERAEAIRLATTRDQANATIRAFDSKEVPEAIVTPQDRDNARIVLTERQAALIQITDAQIEDGNWLPEADKTAAINSANAILTSLSAKVQNALNGNDRTPNGALLRETPETPKADFKLKPNFFGTPVFARAAANQNDPASVPAPAAPEPEKAALQPRVVNTADVFEKLKALHTGAPAALLNDLRHGRRGEDTIIKLEIKGGNNGVSLKTGDGEPQELGKPFAAYVRITETGIQSVLTAEEVAALEHLDRLPVLQIGKEKTVKVPANAETGAEATTKTDYDVTIKSHGRALPKPRTEMGPSALGVLGKPVRDRSAPAVDFTPAEARKISAEDIAAALNASIHGWHKKIIKEIEDKKSAARGDEMLVRVAVEPHKKGGAFIVINGEERRIEKGEYAILRVNNEGNVLGFAEGDVQKPNKLPLLTMKANGRASVDYGSRWTAPQPKAQTEAQADPAPAPAPSDSGDPDPAKQGDDTPKDKADLRPVVAAGGAIAVTALALGGIALMQDRGSEGPAVEPVDGPTAYAPVPAAQAPDTGAQAVLDRALADEAARCEAAARTSAILFTLCHAGVEGIDLAQADQDLKLLHNTRAPGYDRIRAGHSIVSQLNAATVGLNGAQSVQIMTQVQDILVQMDSEASWASRNLGEAELRILTQASLDAARYNAMSGNIGEHTEITLEAAGEVINQLAKHDRVAAMEYRMELQRLSAHFEEQGLNPQLPRVEMTFDH